MDTKHYWELIIWPSDFVDSFDEFLSDGNVIEYQIISTNKKNKQTFEILYPLDEWVSAFGINAKTLQKSQQKQLILRFSTESSVTKLLDSLKNFVSMLNEILSSAKLPANADFCYHLAKKENKDWIKAYKDSIKPLTCGAFYIRPSWIATPTNATMQDNLNPTRTNLESKLPTNLDSKKLYSLGVGNGTDALEIAIKTLNLPLDSQIILPANTFFASVESILNSGYKAVVIDCDEFYHLNLNLVEQFLKSKNNATAIMPVHLYGQSCDMQRVLDLAKKYNLKVIEDAAQAHGATCLIDNIEKRVGSIGEVGCFSFYPGKNLGAFGDGGAIVSDNKKLIDKAKSIANHGITDDKYAHKIIGRNSRLDAIQAAMLSIKLKDLDTLNLKRIRLARIYDELLSQIQGLQIPQKRHNHTFSHIYHLYVICLCEKLEGKREELREFLQTKGIQTLIHYPYSLAQSKALQNNPNVIFTPTQKANFYAKNILSLPMGTHLKEEDIKYIAKNIALFSKGIK